MRIARINSLIGYIILNRFKERVKEAINDLINSGLIDDLLNDIKKDELLDSINAIYLSGDSLMIENSYEGMILRLLQYGGPKIKATHILTDCAKSLGGEL